jgi:SPP1 family phage portal protein
MADENGVVSTVISNDLFGRLDIYASSDEITAENVVSELNTALPYHVQNLLQEDFLYWYRRNVQPILRRTKEVRPEIMNRVQENHADEICTFKNGYFLQKPAFYTARRKGAQGKVNKLNEFLYRSYKQDADNKCVNWFHTVGKGVILVEPDRGNDPETPVHAYALDPRSAFVVYSLRPGNEPVMGVNMVVVDNQAKFDVYTRDYVYHLSGGVTGKMMSTQVNSDFLATAVSVDSVEPNVLGLIPIIEYRYNSINMGAFESVLPLLDEINNIVSNACDGVEQFIQSLAVATNCEFPEGTTSNDIRRAGMIVLKSIGENKADFKILSQPLDQTQTKVLIDHLKNEVYRICAMPIVGDHGRTYDTTGSAVLASTGWFQADTAARNTEDLFKESNRQFDRIFIEILKRRGLLDIDINDFELHIDHGETVNIQAKAQSFNTLIASGMHPELAAAKSGVSNDPVSDIKMSEKWLKLMWGDPDNPQIEGANGIRNTTSAGGDGESQSSSYTEDEEEPKPAEGGEESSMTDEERDAQDRKRTGKKRGGVWISGYWQARGDRK